MKRILIATAVTLMTIAFPGSAMAQQPSRSAKWTKTYVVEWNEPAMYYGAKTGVIDPGTDCPKGTNPEIDWIKVLVDAGYTLEEAKWLRNPANPTRSPVHGQNQMAFRGKDRANVYVNPTSAPDTGLAPVSGAIGEGLNLDGDENTGFTSPTGEKGIDNNFYQCLGCWKTYRGPRRLSSGALQFNDSMRNGAWTTVIVVSGEGADPMNDDNVTVGFYVSNDKMVKDGAGDIARDYSFRIAPHAKYEGIFSARTSDGKIISTAPADIMLRDPGYTRDLELLRARVNLEMKPDGSLTGYVGGYRPWEAVYKGWVNARGPVIESLTWVQLPAVYYALRRSADYSPTGSGGEKTHISFALRIDALPAFVMTPDASKEVASVESYKAIAPKETARPAGGTFVVDGIVPDRSGKFQAGPKAVILPPSASSTNNFTISGLAQKPPAQDYLVYVLSESADKISLIRFGPNGAKVEREITTGLMEPDIDGPHGIAVSPDKEHYFVSLGHGRPFGTVWKYATKDDRVLGKVTLGFFPATMDVSPDGNLLFVVNFNLHGDMVPSSVSVVLTDEMLEIKRITTCTMPHGSRFNPQSARHYSACMMDDMLVEIDTEALKVSRYYRLTKGREIGGDGSPPERRADHSGHAQHDSGGHGLEPPKPGDFSCSPTWAQPSSDGSMVYVACNKSSEIVEVDAKTWKITRRIEAGPGVYNLAVTKDGRLIATNKRGPSVSVFDLKTGKELARIPTRRKVVHGAVVSSDNRYAFISVEGVGSEPGTVEIIDLEALKTVATVDVAQQAAGIDFLKTETSKKE